MLPTCVVHCRGMPERSLAKTLLIRKLADAVDLRFNRWGGR
jgi:hypothetical protein